MLHFLRRIRRSLINTGATRKYLLYAIGEILLVVIGILIALQVNNKSETSKDRASEKMFLSGIMKDMQSDYEYIDEIIPLFVERMNQKDLLDSLVKNNLLEETHLSSFSIRGLFNAPITFFPTSGSYKSMISEGRSNLIRNRSLLSSIQRIYDVNYIRLQKIADRLDVSADKVSWELRHILNDKNLVSLLNFKDPSLINNVKHNNGTYIFYLNKIKETKQNLKTLITEIKKELN